MCEYGRVYRWKEQLLGFHFQTRDIFLWSFFMQKIDRFSTFPTTKISPNNTIFEMYYPDWKIRNILVLFPNNIPNNTNMNSYAILWIILKRHLSVITVITTLLTAYNTPWRTNRTEREGFEPSTKVTSCNSLAGSRFQPLSHLSSNYRLSTFGQTYKTF